MAGTSGNSPQLIVNRGEQVRKSLEVQDVGKILVISGSLVRGHGPL
jgi:hypothetical protein